MNEEDLIRQALIKKAVGYSADDVVEEYCADEDGNVKLSKKKVTTKHYGPDVSAVKVLLERYFKTYKDMVVDMTDQELQEEKLRLEKEIEEEEGGT